MNLIFIFLCFCLTKSYSIQPKSISIILLTAPKKRPELTRSARDLFDAIKNCPDDVVIKEIVFVKGCMNGCDHPELDEVIKKFKLHFPHIEISTPTFIPDDDDIVMGKKWSEEMYESLYPDIRVYDFYYDKYLKHMRVNFYFLSASKYLYEKAECDFILFTEDDIRYRANTFSSIRKLMDRTNDDILFSKIAHYHGTDNLYRKNNDYIAHCRLGITGWPGYYGLLRSREQLRIYITHMKFSKLTESGDTLSEQLCLASNKKLSIIKSLTHFGKYKRIPW